MPHDSTHPLCVAPHYSPFFFLCLRQPSNETPIAQPFFLLFFPLATVTKCRAHTLVVVTPGLTVAHPQKRIPCHHFWFVAPCGLKVTGGLGEWWRLSDAVFWWLDKFLFWFLFWLLANPIEDCGFLIKARFQALKVELQHQECCSHQRSPMFKVVTPLLPRLRLCNYKLNLHLLETC
ncbi:hypothetical protein Cgig2_015230 [Carnegiea gigantea]|uniref:Uncharacterized protein n=1 Tax=Carnegiea gigantea TaxID=171969 RepID=A0A9Q1QKA7_9CARY|nr:hypothetical protein Cgig2_015230 [Carnegiea gigantea]